MSAVPMPTLDAPADFPVRWDSPADAELFWSRDRGHFPDPVTPMEFAVIEMGLGHGVRAAMAAYEGPLVGVESRCLNGYLYQAFLPFLDSPEEMAARAERSEAAVRAAIARMGETWEHETLPEIKSHLEWWAAFDLDGASTPDLVAHLDESWERHKRVWVLHFHTVFPAYVAMSEFDELYRSLFEDAGPLDSYRLIAGVPNMTVEVGQALWRLSRRALAEPEVRTVLERVSSRAVVGALQATGAGRTFLAALRDYLARYGQRSDKWSIGAASWIEDPTPEIKNLRDCLGRPDSDAPAVTTRRTAEARDEAIARTREQLTAYPAVMREQFEGLRAAAEVGVVLSEDHNFWIDYRTGYRLRRVLLEAGRRLAATGVTRERDDVFFLTPEEVRTSLVDGSAADRRALVAERIATHGLRRDVVAPEVLGTPPAGPPPGDPFGRLMAKFSGTPPSPAERPDELTGASGSAGIVRGRARVISSIAEADRLERGDVLVAETTAPPWTPLFATAAAVVTDTGGVLSHCAVVAREYGIPAVVGVGMATAVIADGQMVEVDGDAGIVRLL
jgi:phosphohistidine swiveling domain-containing protein